MNSQNSFIYPNWNAPKNIKAVITNRLEGVSNPPFDSFNLATHVNDDLNLVLENRKLLKEKLNLKNNPIWLNQIHSNTAIYLDNTMILNENLIDADASFTDIKNIPSVVMTADCLPLLVTDIFGRIVGAIHAGWRGLLNGVIENTINQMRNKNSTIHSHEILVYLGPAISQKNFEVGQEVFDLFTKKHQDFAICFIKGTQQGKYFADIYQLARLHLCQLDILSEHIFGGTFCSFDDDHLFYSFRKQNVTGRMASLIWIE